MCHCVSGSHECCPHVMIGFTLLPRTFAEYACCRFVEIIVTAGLVFCEQLVGVVLSKIIPLRAGSFVLCIGLCGLSAPRRRFVGMRIDFYFWCVFSSSRLLFFRGGGIPFLFGRLFSLRLLIVMGSGFAECCTLWLICYLVTKKLRERIPVLGLGFVRRLRFISDYLGECPSYGVW